MIEAAINDDPHVPEFIQRFQTDFPVGVVDRMTAATFMQFSPMMRTYVPYMAFIDRKGEIRAQYSGSDDFLRDENAQDKNIREEAEKLLSEKPPGTPPHARKKASK